jgi:hypothetical protein
MDSNNVGLKTNFAKTTGLQLQFRSNKRALVEHPELSIQYTVYAARLPSSQHSPIATATAPRRPHLLIDLHITMTSPHVRKSCISTRVPKSDVRTLLYILNCLVPCWHRSKFHSPSNFSYILVHQAQNPSDDVITNTHSISSLKNKIVS